MYIALKIYKNSTRSESKRERERERERETISCLPVRSREAA